jgi:hypothetical protein
MVGCRLLGNSEHQPQATGLLPGQCWPGARGEFTVGRKKQAGRKAGRRKEAVSAWFGP